MKIVEYKLSTRAIITDPLCPISPSPLSRGFGDSRERHLIPRQTTVTTKAPSISAAIDSYIYISLSPARGSHVKYNQWYISMFIAMVATMEFASASSSRGR